jgi:hypothetical protein
MTDIEIDAIQAQHDKAMATRARGDLIDAVRRIPALLAVCVDQKQRIAELTAPLQRTRPAIVDDGNGKSYACPSCGGTQFKYEEDYGTDRHMVENNAVDGVITFDADFEWYEGDCTPAWCAPS